MPRNSQTYRRKASSQQHGRRAAKSNRFKPPVSPLVGFSPISTKKLGKLRKYRADLERWFGQELTLETIRERLAAKGCQVTCAAISAARQKLWREALQESVLMRIATGAEASRKVAREMEKHGTPPIDTLIKVVQGLAFTIATSRMEVIDAESLTSLLKPVLEWTKIQIKEREASVAERRVVLLEEEAAKARKAKEVASDGQLTDAERLAKFREIFGVLPSAVPAVAAA